VLEGVILSKIESC